MFEGQEADDIRSCRIRQRSDITLASVSSKSLGLIFILKQVQPKKHPKADRNPLVFLLESRTKSAAPNASYKYSAVKHSSAALGLLVLHIEFRTTQNN